VYEPTAAGAAADWAAGRQGTPKTFFVLEGSDIGDTTLKFTDASKAENVPLADPGKVQLKVTESGLKVCKDALAIGDRLFSFAVGEQYVVRGKQDGNQLIVSSIEPVDPSICAGQQ
jgi:hypothetical protein